MCQGVLPACICLRHTHAMFVEARGGPWNDRLWILGLTPRLSGRAAGLLTAEPSAYTSPERGRHRGNKKMQKWLVC